MSIVFYTLITVSALKIHMSNEAHEAVMAFPEFITEPRGETFIKVIINIFVIKMFLLYPFFQIWYIFLEK